MKKLLSLSISLALLGTGASALALSANPARHIPPRQVIGKVGEDGRGVIEWYSHAIGRRPVALQNVAQTFTASGNDSLSGVALQVARSRNAVGRGTERAAVTVSVYASDSPDASRKDRIFSGTTRLPGRLHGGDYLVFDLEKKVKLKKGKRYTVTFEFESPRPGQSLTLATGGHRGHGRAYIYSNDRRHKSPRWEATRENLSLVLIGK